jgi:hypothetical protein
MSKHTDDPQKFNLYMDLTMEQVYWIKMCMKLITVKFHDNYYSHLYHLSCKLVQ